MAIQNNLIIHQADFDKLSALVSGVQSELENVEMLADELSRASVVSEEKLPRDVVAMNSKVSFEDMETGKLTEITLVYPHDANIEENKISILTPVGSALIGLKVGHEIEWPVPNGKERKLKVLSVSC